MTATAPMPFPRWRDDVLIRDKDQGGDGKLFVVYDPVAGERYEFDERTFFLCESFDGVTPAEQIAQSFAQRFDSSIRIEELLQVFDELVALGLLAGAEPAAVAAFRGDPPDASARPDAAPLQPAGSARDDDDGKGEGGNEYRWPLFNPSGIFDVLNRVVKPLRLLILLFVYALFLTLPIALFSFFDNQLAMSQDLARLGHVRSYLGRLIFSLLSINLMRCVVQGIVVTYFGGQIKTFGIRLRFGIIPRFYIDKSAIRSFDRHGKLWSYGSNLLMRMGLIVLAVLAWHLFRYSGNQLAVQAIILTHAGLISLILVSLPLRSSDGYRWMVTYFRLPPSLIKLAIMVLVAIVTRKPVTTAISPTFKRRLFLYGTALVMFWTYAFFRITSHVSAGLARSFPNLFGEATEVIITAIVVLLVLRWGMAKVGRLFVVGGTASPAERLPAVGGEVADPLVQSHPGTSSRAGGEARWIARGVRLLLLAGLIVVLALPFPFRPGGPIKLLPPQQQAIQAPVSGKVTRVSENGGDGRLLSRGTEIAVMASSSLQTSIATLQEQVSERQALLQKQQAVLERLVAGPRSEEIAQARALAESAEHEVALARHQLETGRVTSHFSDQELQRIVELPSGVISELNRSRSEKQAEVDRMHIAELESNLAAKRKHSEEAAAALDLLRNGASDADIEVARQDLAAAAAELRRVQAELAHARDQSGSGRLTMPFDGYLVDAYLGQKLGSYLAQGETYAVVQTHQQPMVELLLPEYEVGEMTTGAEAEVRLLTFPGQSFRGQVYAIEPSGQPAELGQVFKVVIELADVQYQVRPGMTGYAKVLVGEKPLLFIIARPLVRFFQIEAWSWLP